MQYLFKVQYRNSQEQTLLREYRSVIQQEYRGEILSDKHCLISQNSQELTFLMIPKKCQTGSNTV